MRVVTALPENILTVDIVDLDLPRLSPMLQVSDRKMVRQSSSQVATSLPSFASFSEHAATRSDEADADGPEIAPMASRLPCSLCTKLQPMVQEVAVAIAELDENIQLYSNRPVTKVCFRSGSTGYHAGHICGLAGIEYCQPRHWSLLS